MSKEVLEMAAKMGFREIETKLILQCSPFIVGVSCKCLPGHAFAACL